MKAKNRLIEIALRIVIAALTAALTAIREKRYMLHVTFHRRRVGQNAA